MDCETDGVVPNHLCGSCARIVGKSRISHRLIYLKEGWDMQRRHFSDATKEIFFHSPTLETIMSSVVSGCHLCSIVSWDEDKYFRHKGQSGIPSALEHSNGIVQVSVTEERVTCGQTIMSFDILSDIQTSASQMEDADRMDS